MTTPIVPSAVLGIASSVLTEVFKKSAFLSKSPMRKALTAIVVVFGLSFGYTLFSGASFTPDLVISALVFALVSYKAIVEPTVKTAQL